jgi:hypothetical protein
MIDFSAYGGHRGGRDLDTYEGSDEEDFLAALEADELADGDEDHEAALASWREAQDADGGDELECGLSRAQLRVAARVLFGGLAEIFNDVLKYSHGRTSKDGTGIKNGAVVSAAMVAALAVALELPGYQRGAVVAKSIKVTRAGISIHAAKFGRMLGTTSEQSARKQMSGIMARARVKAKLPPSKGGEPIHTFSALDRERPETRKWLESLPDDEKAEARRALKGRV